LSGDIPAAAPYGAGRVRASLLAYSVGKVITAPLSLLLVLMLAALMSREQYAAYVASIALLEIGVVLGTFGVEWVMQTALAAIRVHGNAAQLRRAVLCLGVLPGVSYTLGGCLLWVGAERASAAIGAVAPPALLQLAAVLLALEGPGRILRDSLMAVLLMQRSAQISQVVRVAGTFGAVVITVIGAGVDEPLQAQTVLRIEIAVAALALLTAVTGLAWSLRGRVAGQDASIGAWVGRHSIRFASQAYLSIVLMLLIGTDVMTTQVARHLGAEATARFGFVVRLVETARRYLPMDLFWGVVRPAAIGRYESAGRDATRLMDDCNRMIDANLIAVAFVLSLAMVAGDALVQTLSRGKVADAGWLLVALLPLLATHTVRRGVELLAYTRGQAACFARAALCSLLAVPLSAMLLAFTGQPHAAALGVLATDLLFIVVAIRGLRQAGVAVRLNLARWGRLLQALAVSTLLGMTLVWQGQVVLAAVVTALLFAGLLRVLRVVRPGEPLLIRLKPEPPETAR